VGRVITGASNAEIALDLGVSLATAKRHLANVMLKWRCSNRTQVAIDALWRAGFVDPIHDHKSQPETSPTSGRFP
jgi:DNA-binding NarL/FixJ family response regulator